MRLVYSASANCPAANGYLTLSDVAIWSGGANMATGKTITATPALTTGNRISYSIDADNSTYYQSTNPRCRRHKLSVASSGAHAGGC